MSACTDMSELDIMVSQVLSVLPHVPADIIRNDLSMYVHVVVSFIDSDEVLVLFIIYLLYGLYTC